MVKIQSNSAPKNAFEKLFFEVYFTNLNLEHRKKFWIKFFVEQDCRFILKNKLEKQTLKFLFRTRYLKPLKQMLMVLHDKLHCLISQFFSL